MKEKLNKKEIVSDEELLSDEELDAIICNTIEPDMEPITMRNFIKAVEDMKKGIDVAGSGSLEDHFERMRKLEEEIENEGK